MSSAQVKKTLLLDNETVDILKEFGLAISGSENLSAAVRTLAREYKKQQKASNKNTQDF